MPMKEARARKTIHDRANKSSSVAISCFRFPHIVITRSSVESSGLGVIFLYFNGGAGG
ncbi:hypothetical protein [Paenibacillus ginsengarvi]|uniref:hypothetical protein n=1 Tax=Paenibacillus ginsengarvi TaxID=400777 RepID=UPI001315766F|nr:hypothetical protein [Paenibacillus ginsengarvi]